MAYKVSKVAPTTNGYGFNITNERGAPIVMFGYEQEHDAGDAAAQVRAAISKVRWVIPARL
jgi:hypothetical protein